MSNLENEIWKDVQGYEGKYQISNLGRVKSLPRKFINGKSLYHERILKPITMGNYLGVQLGAGTQNKKYLHRLVAQAFINNPQNKREVNHIDGDRYNNHLENLEWVTREENQLHAIETGLRNSNGENNPMCKFTDETVQKIRSLYATGKYKQSELSEMFGMSRMQTNRIVRNLLRKGV